MATEVKQLAKQTADATQEIRNCIEGIQGTTGVAIRWIGEISGVIGEVSHVSMTIASAVEQQSIATQEIARSISETSLAVELVSAGVHQTATSSDEITTRIAGVDEAARHTAAGADQTRQAGVELAKLADVLQNLVDQFQV